jgi:hypothetical protein
MTASWLLPTLASPALIAEAVIILLASESVTLLSIVFIIPSRIATAISAFKLARMPQKIARFTI